MDNPALLCNCRYSEQDRQCTSNVTLRRFRESLLLWKSDKYYIFVSVCARVRACVGVRERGRVHARACNLAYPSCDASVFVVNFCVDFYFCSCDLLFPLWALLVTESYYSCS
jgi:hypothetical protein